jgi:hypothetical protein
MVAVDAVIIEVLSCNNASMRYILQPAIFAAEAGATAKATAAIAAAPSNLLIMLLSISV